MNGDKPENWKNTFLLKRNAQCSQAFLFENNGDINRIRELRNFVQSIIFEKRTISEEDAPKQDVEIIATYSGPCNACKLEQTKRKDEKFRIEGHADYAPRKLLWDAWVGLLEYKQEKRKKEGAWEPCADLKTPQSITGQPSRPTAQAISAFVDDAMKKEPTILILTGITTKAQADGLIFPLQSWAFDDDISKQRSSILVSTSSIELFDLNTRKLTRELTPPYSTDEERKATIQKVIENLTGDGSYTIEYSDDLVQQSKGMTLHDLETSLFEGFYRAVRFSNGTHVKANTLAQFVNKMKEDIMSRQKMELVNSHFGFEAVGGYKPLKEYLRGTTSEIISSELAKKWGVRASRGILFFGPPGCGKDHITQALAKELAIPLINFDASSVYTSALGGSEQNLKTVLKTAEENAPDILQISEVDHMLPKREGQYQGDSGTHRSVIDMFMAYAARRDRQAFIIASTNLIDECDPAAIRSGRFSDKIPILYPDRAARREIISVQATVFRHLPMDDLSKDDMNSILDYTVLYSGADLEEVVNKAAGYALQPKRLTIDHFNRALDAVRINRDERESQLEVTRKQLEKVQGNLELFQRQYEQLQQELGHRTSSTRDTRVREPEPEKGRAKAMIEGITS